MAAQFEELIGPTLLNAEGKEVSTSEVLKGKKHIMLYFSAHWCPPCRKFTPLLADAYKSHKEYLLNGENEEDDDGEIEIIFVSSDSVKSQYDEYRNTMPWLTVPFENLHKLRIKDDLSKKYSVRGIPALIVLDGESGNVVTMNGRGQYTSYFKGEYSTGSYGCVVS